MGKDRSKNCKRVFTLTIEGTRYIELIDILKSISAKISREKFSYETLTPTNLKQCTFNFIKVSCSDLEITRYLIDYCDFLNGYLSTPPEKKWEKSLKHN